VISVVVPARNEAAVIARCLAALRDQSMAPDAYEVIVVDHGSTDATAELARRFTPHVLVVPHVHVGALRNRGAHVARGDVLAFIDADCVASATWLAGAAAALADALADGGVAVGNKYDFPADAGWIEPLWLGRVPPGRWRTDELWSGNMVVTRAAFEACGGFDESLVSSEDVVLTHALGRLGPLYGDARVRVVHEGGPRNLGAFARQQLWHGFEEWTLFRRGIARASFAPTMLMLAGAALVAAAFLARGPMRVAGGGTGAAIAVAAPLWHLRRQVAGRSPIGGGAAARLMLLSIISIPAKALAVVLRAMGWQWSGRRKRASASRGAATA
jgi:hypothetical protein